MCPYDIIDVCKADIIRTYQYNIVKIYIQNLLRNFLGGIFPGVDVTPLPPSEISLKPQQDQYLYCLKRTAQSVQQF